MFRKDNSELEKLKDYNKKLEADNAQLLATNQMLSGKVTELEVDAKPLDLTDKIIKSSFTDKDFIAIINKQDQIAYPYGKLFLVNRKYRDEYTHTKDFSGIVLLDRINYWAGGLFERCLTSDGGFAYMVVDSSVAKDRDWKMSDGKLLIDMNAQKNYVRIFSPFQELARKHKYSILKITAPTTMSVDEFADYLGKQNQDPEVEILFE